jgi:hypothetical protein
MLPPKTTADYPSHGDSDLAAGAAVALVARRRRTAWAEGYVRVMTLA